MQTITKALPYQKLRKEALAKSNYLCEWCGATEKILTHHLKYPAQNIDDLRVLCSSCHSIAHFNKPSVIWDREKLKIYCEQSRSLREIGNLFNTSYERIRQKLVYFNLKKKSYGMRVTRSITLTLEIIAKIKLEAKENHRSFSNMVEHILRSHYLEKDGLLPNHNESQRNLYNEIK